MNEILINIFGIVIFFLCFIFKTRYVDVYNFHSMISNWNFPNLYLNTSEARFIVVAVYDV